MGMGDKQEHYRPHHDLIRDDVMGMRFADCSVRRCPHPSVIKRYGIGGVCNVSLWTCKKCKYVIRETLFEGYRCGYDRLGQ